MADDITDLLAVIAKLDGLPAIQATCRDAIEEITRLRLRLHEARHSKITAERDHERALADTLAGALRGVIDYGPVANGDGYLALQQWDQTRRG